MTSQSGDDSFDEQRSLEEEHDAERIFDSEADWFTGRQVYRRKPKKANEIIGRLMARTGFNQQQSHEQIQSVWESLLEDRFRGMTRATGIRAGNLMVIVKNPVINQELAFRKADLLEGIKNSPIGNRIKDIRFQVGVF